MSTPGTQVHHGYEGVVNLQVPNLVPLPPSPSYLPHPPISFSSCYHPALPDMTSLPSVPRMDAQPKGPLPVPHPWPFSHLPTPQSPNNLARYVGDHTPQSPLHDLHQPSDEAIVSSSYQRPTASSRSAEETPTKSNGSRQCITPESSPSYVPQTTSSLRTDFATPSAIRNNSVDTPSVLTPKNFHVPSTALNLAALAPSPHISSPVSVASENASCLSSPFVAKLSMAERAERCVKTKQILSVSATPIPMDVDDIFSSPLTGAAVRSRLTNRDFMNSSLLPASPPPLVSTSSASGELDQIRQALIQDHLAQVREAENRRPDYLKRTKRPISDVHSTLIEGRDRGFAVGITESPKKGRRLKLYQGTSEEGFEENLMADGYGCYRINDLVRQSQPISLISSNITRRSNMADILVQRVEALPTEKELKKRKRLEAFHTNCRRRSTLTPIDIRGRGRMLLELPKEGKATIAGNKRKRRSTDMAPGGDKTLDQGEELDAPNWPDDEFPWKIRKQELSEAEKVLEDERLKWIEKFLDRDTDDEDDGEEGFKRIGASDDEIFPSAKWGHVYEHDADKSMPVRMGRGKMVPLLTHPLDSRRAYAKKSVFPSDPSDARAALLAKKNVRALAYRNQRRQQEMAVEDEGEDIVICVCHGKDDGRELVQCDGCQTWYHLQCIGIRSIAELGREEDAWFCRNCVTRSPSPERDSLLVVYQEPTFVPTDDAPRVRRNQDPTLYQPLYNSPLWNPPRIPKTPTRGGRYPDFDLSSSSDSTRLPSTPQNSSHDIRLYNTPGSFEYHPSTSNDDPPFDPNSTPSRGIKFGAFATPKSNPWSIRAGGLFHTPSRHHTRGSFGRSFGSLEDMGGSFGTFDGLTRYPNVEDSPIRRSAGREGFKARKVTESPLQTRPLRIWET